MRFLYLVAAVFVSVLSGEAQQIFPGTSAAPRASADPLGRSNPQSAVIGFLEACRAQDYAEAASYLDLRTLPVSRRAVDGPTLARQLEQLLDGNMAFDASSLSRNLAGDAGTGGPETVGTSGTHADREGFRDWRIKRPTENPTWREVPDRNGNSSKMNFAGGSGKLPERSGHWRL